MGGFRGFGAVLAGRNAPRCAECRRVENSRSALGLKQSRRLRARSSVRRQAAATKPPLVIAEFASALRTSVAGHAWSRFFLQNAKEVGCVALRDAGADVVMTETGRKRTGDPPSGREEFPLMVALWAFGQ